MDPKKGPPNSENRPSGDIRTLPLAGLFGKRVEALGHGLHDLTCVNFFADGLRLGHEKGACEELARRLGRPGCVLMSSLRPSRCVSSIWKPHRACGAALV